MVVTFKRRNAYYIFENYIRDFIPQPCSPSISIVTDLKSYDYIIKVFDYSLFWRDMEIEKFCTI